MTFQFKIQLKNITKPPVWRKVVVPSNITFSMFHSIIQVAMGWYDSHLYSFSPTGYGSEPWIEEDSDMFSLGFDDDNDDDNDDDDELTLATKLKLSDIFKTEGQTFTYIYDFGDDWEHKITLEEIDKLNISPIPKLIGGKGACPPEDCGGAWGYENMKEVLSDKNHPEHEDMKEWLYGYDEDEDDFGDEIAVWDPNEYNLEEEKEMFDEVFKDLV